MEMKYRAQYYISHVQEVVLEQLAEGQSRESFQWPMSMRARRQLVAGKLYSYLPVC
jgi:hypothetical protein